MITSHKPRRADELPAPTVREAENSHLSADLDFATVEIQPWAGMAVDDRVDLLWEADVTGQYTDWLPVSAATVGHMLTFQVQSQYIAPNHEAAVNYVVTRANGEVVSSFPLGLQIGEPVQLPAPSVDGVTGSIINPEEHPDGVTVRIPAAAELASGDLVTVRWSGQPGEGTTELEVTVGGAGAGSDLTVHIPASVVNANSGYRVDVSYRVTRAATGVAESSAVAVYDVGTVAVAGALKVMGARSQRKGAQHGLISPVRILSALNRDTLALQEATWQYEGEGESVSGVRFRDTQPDRLLHVRSADDHIILNASNINGTSDALVARRNAGNVVAWGARDYGGGIPSTIATMTDIAETAGSFSAFAARRTNGTVVAWGSGSAATVPLNIATLTDITALSAGGMAFAVLRKNGSVAAWGTAGSGGSVPSGIASLTDIVQIDGSYKAFAALRENGSVVAWGDSSYGGSVPSSITTLTDMVELTANEHAFAARRTNGSVVVWGDSRYGGELPGAIAALTDVVEIVAGNSTFAALRANGTVVAWGNSQTGGTVPSTIAMLDDIVQVTGHHMAFAALRENGRVVAWGDTENGGMVPSTIATLDDVIQVTGNGSIVSGREYGAFIALRANGTVVAWGHSAVADIPPETQALLTDVRAVYCADKAVAALTSDSRVVTWGVRGSGGDSSSVQVSLNGQVSYEATGPSRGIGRHKGA